MAEMADMRNEPEVCDASTLISWAQTTVMSDGDIRGGCTGISGTSFLPGFAPIASSESSQEVYCNVQYDKIREHFDRILKRESRRDLAYA